MKRKRRSQLTLAQLQVLIAIADSQSFTRASLELDMSQSAVSNAIATLEADLGIVVFSRGRYGAQLTPVGEEILVYARQMMALEEEIVRAAHLSRSLQGGTVRIASFRSVSTHVLPRAIALFRQRFPDIDIRIAEFLGNEEIRDELRRGRVDIGFVDISLGEDYEIFDLFQDEYIALIPKSFSLRGTSLAWDDLQRFPIIMGLEGDGCDVEVLKHCASYGVILNIVQHVRADSTIVGMVAEGLGATIIPRLVAEPIPSSIDVYSLPVPLFRTVRTAILAHALHPPPVFAFLDLINEVACR